jgi:fructose-bisphosphate aldolase, class I
VPLILKLNGKTDIPDAIDPLSPVNASVRDAVRLGADAVGYTLYVGSPAQEHDFRQYVAIRDEARQPGMPLIVWSYPRGTAVDRKGGKDSFYAVDYAARTASELGADVVKVNFPHPEKQSGVPRFTSASSVLSRRSTQWSDRQIARCCWSRAGSAPGTRPC